MTYYYYYYYYYYCYYYYYYYSGVALSLLAMNCPHTSGPGYSYTGHSL